MTPGSSPLLIGWKEYVAFPEWGIRRLRAKVDTGACTSAVDVVEFSVSETPARPIAHLSLA